MKRPYRRLPESKLASGTHHSHSSHGAPMAIMGDDHMSIGCCLPRRLVRNQVGRRSWGIGEAGRGMKR